MQSEVAGTSGSSASVWAERAGEQPALAGPQLISQVISIRSGNTFVRYGPLMEFRVEGEAPGSRISMSGSGGAVDVEWQLAGVGMGTVSGRIRVRSAGLRSNRAVRWAKRVGFPTSWPRPSKLYGPK